MASVCGSVRAAEARAEGGLCAQRATRRFEKGSSPSGPRVLPRAQLRHQSGGALGGRSVCVQTRQTAGKRNALQAAKKYSLAREAQQQHAPTSTESTDTQPERSASGAIHTPRARATRCPQQRNDSARSARESTMIHR